MAINIQNIVNQLNTRLAAVDSATTSSEILKLSSLADQVAAPGGVLKYQFPHQLPAVDSGQIGTIAFIKETDHYYDSAGTLVGHFPKFFIAKNDSDGWGEMSLAAKSNADSDYQAMLIPEVVEAWVFQGTVSGYTSGGFPSTNVIDKFPFASDANATDVGDLTAAVKGGAGQSSEVSGYNSGGSAPPGAVVNVIEKFSFAADANATDVGDLTQLGKYATGQSSEVSGYTSGGFAPIPVAPYSTIANIIDKFPFASDANASDVGDLTLGKYSTAGQSSTASGYNSGGGPPNLNVIEKFPFAADANATDVGDLTLQRKFAAGQSSTENGYTSGGAQPANGNIIDKFPFASDANATDVGDLTVARYRTAGQSSTSSGYTSGGTPPNSNVIDKFPFAADGNATDVGDITVARYYASGQQV